MVRRIVPTVVVLVLLAAGLVLAPRSSVSAVARRSSPAASPATCVTTTPDQNAALVRRFIEEIWGQGNATTVDEVVAPDFVVHIPDLARYFPTAHAPRPGRAGLKASIKELHTDDPDLQITIDDLIVDGNTVAARMTWAGTQADDFEIWRAPKTGRRIEQSSMAFWRIACGQISEQGVQHDDLTVLRQLGIVTDDELRTASTPTVATPAP